MIIQTLSEIVHGGGGGGAVTPRPSSGADLASPARRGAGFPWGGALLLTLLCSLQRYCTAVPALPLFEMVESACSPFCYVLHYLLFISV